MLNDRIPYRISKEDSVYLQLSKSAKNWEFQNQSYTFLKKLRRISNFYQSRQLQVIGLFSEVSIDKNRLILGFTDFRYRNAVSPQNELVRKRNSWVRQLTYREEFILTSQTLALYLPLTLPKRSFGSRSTANVFSGNRNCTSTRYQRSPYWSHLWNYPWTSTWSGTSFNPFYGAPSFLCFLTVELPFRNLDLSDVDWNTYSWIPCGFYV